MLTDFLALAEFWNVPALFSKDEPDDDFDGDEDSDTDDDLEVDDEGPCPSCGEEDCDGECEEDSDDDDF